MKTAWMRVCFVIALGVAGCAAAVADEPVASRELAADSRAIATFHCVGLYWSPVGGAADKEVLVRYRQQGHSAWKVGLPMRYNPIAGTEEGLADYRGSIVHLAPGTSYDVELTLAGTSTTAQLQATTWREDFAVGHTVRVEDADRSLVISESGPKT